MRTIKIKAKPNSKKSGLEQGSDGVWIANLKSPPVDGKANAELVELIAKHFKCKKRDVNIKSGSAGRIKIVQII